MLATFFTALLILLIGYACWVIVDLSTEDESSLMLIPKALIALAVFLALTVFVVLPNL